MHEESHADSDEVPTSWTSRKSSCLPRRICGGVSRTPTKMLSSFANQIAVTATHLKRLFANQDVLNSLDRNTAGFTVSEVDEKEPKTGLADTGVTEDSEPPTPTASDPGPADALLDSDSLTPAGTSDGGVTPLAGLVNPVSNAMSPPQSPAGTNDSDSTIGAKKVGSPLRLIQKSADAVESSGMDSDALGFPFPSRLPRRTKPTPRWVITGKKGRST